MGGVENGIQKDVLEIKIDEQIYQKMCAIHMGHEKDVEAYYEWFSKLNSIFAPPRT
jgi:hypothetical protein